LARRRPPQVGKIANVGKAEPDKQMAAISADRQSVVADKRRNGRYRSRTRTVARGWPPPCQSAIKIPFHPH